MQLQMTGGTRLRSLEGCVKKQEARLQEAMETFHISQQQLRVEIGGEIRVEMENSNIKLEKLEASMVELEQKFNSFLQMIMNREKNPVEEARERPLLPMPPHQQRINKEVENSGGFIRREEGRIYIPNPPKLELPLFYGENPQEWLRKCNKYFLNYQVPENQKVDIVEMFLEGKADRWFQGLKMENSGVSWKEFEELLCKRFCNKICRDIVEEFNKIQQVGSVENYQKKFEELKPLMLMKILNYMKAILYLVLLSDSKKKSNL